MSTRPNDQWFAPGDKVMRTGNSPGDGRTAPPEVASGKTVPQYGVVYCVEDFFEGPLFNTVIFVGGGGWGHHPSSQYPIGWPAVAFRKVEEIKLCIAAVQHRAQTAVTPTT